MRDLLNNSTQKDLLAAKQRSTGTATGTAVDLKGKGRKILVLLSIGGVASSGTLNAVIQTCPTSGFGAVTTLYAFSEKLATGSFVVDLAPVERYIRAVGVVGVATVDFGIWGIIYNEREIPSGI